jgi:hypothetical protein
MRSSPAATAISSAAERRIVIDRAVLRVDGEVVDRTKVFDGDKELKTTLADGTEVAVVMRSGMVGELNRARVRRPDGSWLDLTARG